MCSAGTVFTMWNTSFGSPWVPFGFSFPNHIGHDNAWSTLRYDDVPAHKPLNGAPASAFEHLTASVDLASLIAHNIRSIAVKPKQLRGVGGLLCSFVYSAMKRVANALLVPRTSAPL